METRRIKFHIRKALLGETWRAAWWRKSYLKIFKRRWKRKLKQRQISIVKSEIKGRNTSFRNHREYQTRMIAENKGKKKISLSWKQSGGVERRRTIALIQRGEMCGDVMPVCWQESAARQQDASKCFQWGGQTGPSATHSCRCNRISLKGETRPDRLPRPGIGEVADSVGSDTSEECETQEEVHSALICSVQMNKPARAAEAAPLPAWEQSDEGSTHRGHVFGGKLIGGVGDEQAGFPHGAVAHHHALYGLHLRRDAQDEEGGGGSGDHPGWTSSKHQCGTLKSRCSSLYLITEIMSLTQHSPFCLSCVTRTATTTHRHSALRFHRWTPDQSGLFWI